MTTHIVSPGGTSSGITLGADDFLNASPGGTTATNGVTVTDAILTDVAIYPAYFVSSLPGPPSGPTYSVGSGETSTGITLGSGISLLVDSGGAAISTTVNSRGAEYVEFGGTASSTTVNSGGEESVNVGGTVSFTTVNNGGFQLVSSTGIAISTMVNSGGDEYVTSGGTTSFTTMISGGTENVYQHGTASFTTVSSGGGESVASGGTTVSTIVSSGGIEVVLSGGTASSTLLRSGASLVVLPGGQQTGTMLSGGAIVSTGVVLVPLSSAATAYGSTASDIVVGAGAEDYVLAGGTAISTSVQSGGGEIVSTGGTASFTTVNSYGSQYVSGGMTVSTLLAGDETVFSGGSAIGTTVGSGGYEYLSDDATAVSTTVNSGGNEYAYSGGTVSFTTVNNGGVEDAVSGKTVSTTVNSGGTEKAAAGGTTSDVVLNSGGTETVFQNGAAISTTVNSDGFEVVSSGGSAISTTVSLGGAIDVTYLSYATGGSASVTSGDLLTISMGGHIYAQQLAGGYAGETLQLTQDSGSGTLATVEEQGAPADTPPSINGTVANQGDPGQAQINPFAGVTVSDPTGDGIDTATVTLSSAGNGTLSNLAGGSYSSGTGVYSLSASPSIISAALDGLIFTPLVTALGVYVMMAGFTIAGRGLGGSVSDSTTSVISVQQVLGLALVPTNMLAISLSSDGTGFAAPINGDTNEAVVTSPTTGGTYMLPTGYQAEYLGGSTNATLQDNTVGNAVLIGNAGNDVLIAGATNDSIVAGNGNNTLEGGTGTIALVVGDGNDMITMSAESTYTVTLGGGTDTIYANDSSSSTITGSSDDGLADVTGQHDIIEAGSNGTTINAAMFASSIDGSSGTLTVDDQGYLNTITGGAVFGAAVTTAGYRADVIGGSNAASTLTELDIGLRNTIQGGSGATAVTLDGSSGMTRGGTGSFSVLDQTASNTIIGGTANSMVVTLAAAAANTDVFGRSGNVSVLDQASNALIGSGGGAATVTIDGANAGVYGGTGTLNVAVAAANAIVGGLGASTTVDASSSLASGALVFGGFSNTASLDGSLSVRGGADQLLVVTGGSNSTIDAATSPAVFTGVYIGTGSIAGSNLINGSASALQVNFIGGAGSATVLGGAGAATIFGVDGSDANFVGSTVTGAPGGFLFANGSSVGGETLSAASSTTNDTLYGAVGNDSLVAGSGNDALFAGANTGSIGGSGTVTGGDTFAAGSGPDQMFFLNGSFKGAAVVTGFTSLESVVFVGYNSLAGGNQAAIALANATTTGGDTTIALADGTHITFIDATTAQLQGHLSSN